MTSSGERQGFTSNNAFGVLLVRSKSRAIETAKKLAEKSIPCHCLPLSRPKLLSDSLPNDVVGGQGADFIFTSPTAVEMFGKLLEHQARALDMGGVNAWCVGQKTAEAARQLGFSQVHCATGNVSGLCDLMVQYRKNLSNSVFYMAPRDKASDLSVLLGEQAISVRTVEIYASELVDCGRNELLEALCQFETACVFLYSKRTAEHFFSLLRQFGLLNYLQNMDFISLSDNVASAVPQEFCNRSHVARQPNERFMIEIAGQRMQSCYEP